MAWRVDFYPAFLVEFEELSEAAQDEISALIKLLSASGPQLSRPRCDTLNGSKHANMKELRFHADWCLAARLRIRSRAEGGAVGCRGQVWRQ
jgi:hypothetical protein